MYPIGSGRYQPAYHDQLHDPRTLAWPPYHPWLTVGPLLVRAGGRRLACGRGCRRTFSIRGASYQPGRTRHTHTLPYLV